MSALHVVLGAAGGTGSALVAELAARGHRVRAVARRELAGLPPGVHALRADVTDPVALRGALQGAAVAYHAAQPAYTRWAQEFVPMTAAILDASARAEAKLVLADNLYAYGPSPHPLTEATPMRAEGTKGRVRRAMTELLFEAHAAGRARVALGRSSDSFGPGAVASALGAPLLGPALAGKRVRWPGPIDVAHTVSYTPDVARALATLGEREAADGEVWHLPAAPAPTGREFAALVGAALGRPVRAAPTGRLALRLAGLVSPLLREFAETRYQWERPFVSDASRFEAAFGPFAPTPLPEAVAETVRWFRGRR